MDIPLELATLEDIYHELDARPNIEYVLMVRSVGAPFYAYAMSDHIDFNRLLVELDDFRASIKHRLKEGGDDENG